MCGFAGIFNPQGLVEEDRGTLVGMSQSIRFRGPDENSLVAEGEIAFAFRRLSIIDLSGGSQPKTSSDGRVTGVFNGEIYNYRELKETLTDESFETSSELEIMLKLYRKEGDGFIRKLRGMFAIAFYDREDKTLFLGRDPFGIKPLYYRVNAQGITFASEAKAFLFDPSYDTFKTKDELVQHYFTYQYMPAKEFSGGLSILPAGHYLIFDGKTGEVRIQQYFDPLFKPNREKTYEEKKALLRETLTESVRYHMISDVPVGTFLSSGIDSAIVTALSSKINPGIKAFTVAFGVKDYSEIDDASAITRHLDVEHIKVVRGVEDFKAAFENVVWSLDFPVADPSTVAIYLVCQEAARHLKVVLSGEGADELFGGYKVYDESRFSSKIFGLPKPLRSVLAWLASVLPDNVKGKNLLYRGTTPLEERYVGNAFVFNEKEKEKFLYTFNPDVRFHQPEKEIYAHAKENGLSPMHQMQYVDMRSWIRGDILVKGDRLSMHHSLEVRVPFLDKEVFAVASTLCEDEKLRNGTTKFILRDAFRDLVDEATFMRPKLGYPVPVRAWLKNELYPWAKEILENMTCTQYINREAALQMLEDHKEGRADNYRRLWTILVFVTWYRLYVSDAKETARRVLAGEL
ncbi:MAG: asparagine synthase (glutamine-hydrolyzing) [Clostridia bacterium]|nr:asparagine synthase (glutamine-hydrolyzing) [Clostridia bacterium]